MCIVLNGECFLGALIKMVVAYRIPVEMPAPHVRGGSAKGALHETSGVPLTTRPENQVPVIAHNEIAEDSHGPDRDRLSHDTFEGHEVVVLKDGSSRVGTVEGVENHTSWADPCGARPLVW